MTHFQGSYVGGFNGVFQSISLTTVAVNTYPISDIVNTVNIEKISHERYSITGSIDFTDSGMPNLYTPVNIVGSGYLMKDTCAIKGTGFLYQLTASGTSVVNIFSVNFEIRSHNHHDHKHKRKITVEWEFVNASPNTFFPNLSIVGAAYTNAKLLDNCKN